VVCKIVLIASILKIILEKGCALLLYGKNNFAKISKNLTRYRFLKRILLNYQNCYIRRAISVISNAAKNFDVLAIILISYVIILMIQTKLFSDLYLIKFLDSSAKSFFPCIDISRNCLSRLLNVLTHPNVSCAIYYFSS